MRVRTLLGPAAAMLLPYLLYEYVSRNPALDLSFSLPKGHFYVVSTVAVLAAVVAVAVGIAGTRLRNVKVSFLSLAFVSLAVLFAVHGLSTPDFLLHETHLPRISAPLSLIFCTVWLYLSALPSDAPIVSWLSRYEKRLLPVWTAGILLISTVSMLHPSLIEYLPLNVRPFNYLVSIATMTLNAITMYRYFGSYLYSRFPLQIAIVYSCGLLIVSQWIMVTGTLWKISWWLYHFLLLAAVIVMVVGLLKQYAAKKSLVGAIRALFSTDPVERITHSLSPSVKALMLATEKKDLYTAGHNFRVALYALQLGEELEVRPDQLRALAQGTIIHDVGKIDIPDHILNKPGRLTPEERTVIERHPVKGYDMCRRLGFMREELEVIRFHHEKWDGTGYPDRLRGEAIPLLARIVAVADVYDALTSHRAYRKAMTHEEAMTFLRDNRGQHFDPDCVDAWERVCARNPSAYPYQSELAEEPELLRKAT
jgi:HD-GYP domain-containing protein (c-di-GMP phosphodiesterase class II)